MIYLAEEGGLRARFWEGFNKCLKDHEGESLAQDKPGREVWLVVWFPTKMTAMSAGKKASLAHKLEDRAWVPEGVWKDLEVLSQCSEE